MQHIFYNNFGKISLKKIGPEDPITGYANPATRYLVPVQLFIYAHITDILHYADFISTRLSRKISHARSQLQRALPSHTS